MFVKPPARNLLNISHTACLNPSCSIQQHQFDLTIHCTHLCKRNGLKMHRTAEFLHCHLHPVHTAVRCIQTEEKLSAAASDHLDHPYIFPQCNRTECCGRATEKTVNNLTRTGKVSRLCWQKSLLKRVASRGRFVVFIAFQGERRDPDVKVWAVRSLNTKRSPKQRQGWVTSPQDVRSTNTRLHLKLAKVNVSSYSSTSCKNTETFWAG